MGFIQRLSFVIHVSGFLSGLIALPILLFLLAAGEDDILYILLLVIFLAPSLGWSLFWLVTGKVVHFVPFKEVILSSLPTKDSFLVVLLLIPIIAFSFIVHEETDREQRSWERNVFGMECLAANGQKNVLGTYSNEKAYFCSDFLEETSAGETFCTWSDGANKDDARCRKLDNRPEPYVVEFITPFLATLFVFFITFYLLTLLKIILHIRKT